MRARHKVIRNREQYEHVLACLVQLREQRNKTQAQVAAGIALSRSQYTLIEKGQSTLSIDQLISLAQFYGIEPRVFFASQ